MKRYLVVTIRTPDFQASAITPHYDFLARLRAQDRLELAGPFGDGSGGAYVLKAGSVEEAQGLAHTDPLHTTGSSRVTVHEWNAS